MAFQRVQFSRPPKAQKVRFFSTYVRANDAHFRSFHLWIGNQVLENLTENCVGRRQVFNVPGSSFFGVRCSLPLSIHRKRDILRSPFATAYFWQSCFGLSLFFRFNLVNLVILLLENGASVTMRNKRELTPLQFAHVILDHIFQLKSYVSWLERSCYTFHSVELSGQI